MKRAPKDRDANVVRSLYKFALEDNRGEIPCENPIWKLIEENSFHNLLVSIWEFDKLVVWSIYDVIA